MRKKIMSRVWIYSFTLLVAVTICAQDLDGANDLWRHMADNGLISREQYEYVQQFGCLPGGTVSANVELMEWQDVGSTNYPVRFYRLKRLK